MFEASAAPPGPQDLLVTFVPVQDAPFFVEKLQVKMLPCVVMFVSGVAVDRIVGFDSLGAADDFPTSQVGSMRSCRRVLGAGPQAHLTKPARSLLHACEPLPLPRRPLTAAATAALCQVEKALLKAGVVQPPQQRREDSDDEEAVARRRTMRIGLAQAARRQRTQSDEDSDFE